MTTQQIQALIVQTAKAQGVDPALALAVAQHESSFDPNALGSKGDAGVFQLIPITQKEMGVTDPFDPTQNIAAGVGYLKKMLAANGGDETLALEAYNGGESHVLKGDVSSAATGYADTIMGLIPGAQQILSSLGLASPATTAPPAAGPSIPTTFDLSPTVDAGGGLAVPIGSIDLSQVPWWACGIGALLGGLAVKNIFFD